MDPITALGLGASIVQFVQFTGSVLKTCKEIREDAQSATSKNKRLEESVRELEKFRRNLSSTTRFKQTDRRIAAIAQDCAKIAQELLNMLEFVRGGKSNISMARTVFRTTLNRKRIEEMQIQLNSREKVLNRILIQTTNKTVEQISEFLCTQQITFQASIDDLKRHMASLINDEAVQRKKSERATNAGLDKINRQLQANHLTYQEWHDDAERRKAHERFMATLFFPEMTLRQSGIVTAHHGTLDWIYESSNSNHQPWSNFNSWLQDDSSLYWVSGKAGSGKSTLMAHIVGDPRTKERLNSWSGTQKLCILSFFMWRAGSALQKSTIGFLRSLLYQICRHIPRCIDSITCKLGLSFVMIPAWSEKSLMSAIDIAVSSSDRTCFCLFIDGLDEYEGDCDALVDLIFTLQACDRVKCCVSSRPEALLWCRLVDCQQLRLQDLNRDDIKKLATDRLQELRLTEKESWKISWDIVERAEGVFLWVALAVGSLIKGSRLGDDFETLQRRLAQTPTELTSLFAGMIEKIEPVHQQSLAFYLHAAKLLKSQFMTTMELVTVLHITAARIPKGHVSYAEFVRRCRVTETQIMGQSVGLLMVSTSLPADIWDDDEPRRYHVVPNALCDELRLQDEYRQRQLITPTPEQAIVLRSLEQTAFTSIDWVHRSAYEYVFPPEGTAPPLRLLEYDGMKAMIELAKGAIDYLDFFPSHESEEFEQPLLGTQRMCSGERVGLIMTVLRIIFEKYRDTACDLMHQLHNTCASMPFEELGRGFFRQPADEERDYDGNFAFWFLSVRRFPEYASSHSELLLREMDTLELRVLLLKDDALFTGDEHWLVGAQVWSAVCTSLNAPDVIPQRGEPHSLAPSHRSYLTNTCYYASDNLQTGDRHTDMLLYNIPDPWAENSRGDSREWLYPKLLAYMVHWHLRTIIGQSKVDMATNLLRSIGPSLIESVSQSISQIVEQLAPKISLAMNLYNPRKVRLFLQISWNTSSRLEKVIIDPNRSIWYGPASATALGFLGRVSLMCIPRGFKASWLNHGKAYAIPNDTFAVRLSDPTCQQIYRHLWIEQSSIPAFRAKTWLTGDASQVEDLMETIAQDIWTNSMGLTASQQLFALACIRTNWKFLMTTERHLSTSRLRTIRK